MKQITYTTFLLFSFFISNAQDTPKIEDSGIPFNKWTIEASAGQSKGVRPYAPGYYSSSPNKFFGSLQVNAFTLGARYMIGPKFGFKGALSYESLKNNNGNGSKPFEMQMIGISIQGVINANRLFNIEEYLNRWGFLLHAGIKIDQMTSKTANIIENDHNFGVTEYTQALQTIPMRPQSPRSSPRPCPIFANFMAKPL